MKNHQSLAILPLLLTFSVSGNAATRAWDYGNATANWADPANWDANIVPAAGDTVTFTATGNTPATINLNSTYRDSGNPLFLNLGYGKDLTISGAANAEFYLRDLTVSDAFTYTLNVPRGADANSGTMPFNGATWSVASGGTLLVKSGFGTKSGVASGTFNKDGAGTLRLGDGTAGNAVGQYLSLNARGGLTELGFITTGNAVNGISGIASGATVKITSNLATQTVLGSNLYMNQTGVAGVAGNFDLNGFHQRIAALGGTSTGLVTNNGAADSILTIGVDGVASTRNETSSTFAGVLADGSTNLLSLVVNSLNPAFVQTLSGTNTYTGSTTVSKGTLAVAGGSIANSAVTLDGTGRLATGPTPLSHQTLSLPSLTQLGASAVDLDVAGATADKVAVSGAYDATGGTVEVNVAAAPTAAAYEILTFGSLTGSPVVNVNLPSSRITAGTPVIGANSISLSFSGSVADLVWTGAASNDWALADSVSNFTNGGTPDVFKSFDNVLFDDTTTFTSPSLVGTLNAATVTFAGSSDYSLGGTGSLAGGTAIVKNGNHTLTIANTTANTFAGSVTINGGILKAGIATALGAASGATTINTGGTLDINAQNLGSEPVNLAGGTLTNDGAQQTQALTNFTVSGASTIRGLGRWDVRGATAVTTVNSGAVLTKEDSNIVYLGVVAGSQLVNNGQIVANAGQVGVSNSTISGSGSFRANSGGTIQIETPVANPLPVTLNGGILGLTTANASQSAGVTLLADSLINATPALNATATIPNSVFTTVSGNVVESGGAFKLTKTGAGALAVSGTANHWTGGTVVNGGILQANVNQCLGTGVIVVGTSDLGGTNTNSLRPNGVTLDNDIELNYQYTVDFKGTLTAVGGATSTLNGDITVKPPVNATRRGGDLASDATAGSVLRLMGELNAGTGLTNIVQRDGTVEYGGGSSTEHLLTITGTARLVSDTGIGSGVLVRVGTGTLDINGRNAGIAGLESNSTAAIVTNNAATDATLTVTTAATPPIVTTPAITGIFTGKIQDGPTHKTLFFKDGPGTLTRTGANTHSGATTVHLGTLAGTGSDASPLAVHAGATLAPGTGIGTFGCAAAEFQAGSTLAIQIDSALGQADKLAAFGNIDLATGGAGVVLALTDAAASPAALTAGTVLVIADYSGNSLTGGFAGLGEGVEITVGPNKFLLSYNNGSKITLTVAAGGYVSWAAANANNEPASGDFDKDGTPNGIEYFMGQTGSGFTPHPPVVTAAGVSTITWPKDPAFTGAYVVKTSTDLSAWIAVTGGATGTVTDNGSSVVYTFPAGSGSRFARLEVTVP